MTTIVAVSATGGSWSPYALSLRNYAAFRYGQEFYRASQKAGSPLVRAYLLGHTLEMFLKAYLLSAGMRASVLKSKRKFGHNLANLLSEASARGLGQHVHISAKSALAIIDLSKVYPEQLRYFSLNYLFVPPSVPPLAPAFRAARTLEQFLLRHLKVEA